MTQETTVINEVGPPEETALVVSKPTAVIENGVVKCVNYTELRTLCKDIAASGLAPKGMNAAQVLVAIQMGAELGLAPMASLRTIAVINGRPAIWGDGMLALCRESPVFDANAFKEYYEGDPESEEYAAVCECKRKDGQLVVSKFAIRDAKLAGLWGKAGPWKTYPDRMLKMRARSWALRDTFADVLQGLQCGEEVRDYAPERGDFDPNKAVGAQGLADRLGDDSGVIDGEIISETPAKEE